MADENPFRVQLQKLQSANPFRAKLQEQETSGPRTRGQIARSGTEPVDDDGPNSLGIFLERALRGTGNAIMATPSATGDLLAAGSAAVEGTVSGLMPGGEGFDYRRRYQEQQNMFPANVIRAIPRPTVEDVVSGGRAAMAAVPGGVSPGDQFEFSQQAATARREQQEQDAPIASFAGDLGGDVAALLLTKKPAQGTIRRIEDMIMNPRADDAAAGITRVIDEALKSRAVRLPTRGLARAAETGIEAAYLEAVSEAENDPMVAFGLGAAAQTLQSGSLAAMREMFKGGPGKGAVNLAITALATGGIWQMVKEATPGGRDRILESVETGFGKVTGTLAVGLLAGMAGGFRGRTGEWQQQIPDVMDAISATPRVAVLNLITKFADAPPEEQATFESVMDRLSRNPAYEGETDLERQIIGQLREAFPEEEPETRMTRRGTRPAQ